MNFNPLKLACIVAVAASSITLTGCISTGGKATEASPIVRAYSDALSQTYATMRKAQVSDVAYTLSFDIEQTKDTFEGVSVIDFNMANDNTSALTIDFESGTVKYVKLNGNIIPFEYKKWFISISPSLIASGSNTLEIAYSRKYETDGSGFHRFKDPENGDVYLYSDFEPYAANQMFPHFDQPNLKATFKVDVNAPKHWQIISTTRETSITTKGQSKHWDFPVSAKISSYVFALHAGKYSVWEDTFQGEQGDIPLRLFVRQSMAKYVDTTEWFVPTKQSFAFFNQYFDIAYPFGKYDQVVVPDFNSGAMENVAAVTFTENFISRGDKTESQRLSLADTIAHEMAHMWFGDLVTMDWWNGLWLNESFASYMAVLALEKSSDFDNVWDDFYTGFKQWAYRTDKSVNTHAIELPVATTNDAMTNFDGITYGKGASVLKQIPKYLGEENFRIGVSNYLKKFAYKNTSLDDFINSLAQAANTDLSKWTQDWLYHAGVNTIEVSYQCQDNRISQFSVLQSAPQEYPTLRDQRINIGLFNTTSTGIKLSGQTAITYSGAKTDVSSLVGEACPDLVYPNLGDWAYVQVNLDKRSLTTLNESINNFESPSLRLMLWQSLIDSVDDAKLSPAVFVDFALKNLKHETDLSVVREVSGHLSGALGYLNAATRLNVADYSAKRRQVTAFYYQQLVDAKAGSDSQKMWYRRFISTAKGTKNLQRLSDILDGKLVFNGLTIDQDKRWSIVRRLNQYEFGNYKQRLITEAKNDGSDTGKKNGILAEVLRPDASIKAKWFDVLIHNPDELKLSTLRYIMWGLFPREQKSLEQPYVERILAHVEVLNEQGELRMLSSFVSAMIPTECTASSYERLSGLVEQYKGMKPQVVKSIKVTHQYEGRCVEVLEKLI